MRKAALMVWISLLVQGQYCMMDLLLFLLLLLCCTLCMFCSLLPVSHGAQGYYARKLLNDLMENYSNALRPVEDTDAALNVSLQITLSQIKDMVNNQSVNQSSYPSIYLRYLSIHLSIHMSIHPFIHPPLLRTTLIICGSTLPFFSVSLSAGWEEPSSDHILVDQAGLVWLQPEVGKRRLWWPGDD